MLGEGSTFVPPDGGSLISYMDSLARLQAEPIELICPGHGPWIEDPAAKLAEYVEHREMRERKLLAALERGERSREALLAEAWDDVPAELRPAAAMVMDAHLRSSRPKGGCPRPGSEIALEPVAGQRAWLTEARGQRDEMWDDVCSVACEGIQASVRSSVERCA